MYTTCNFATLSARNGAHRQPKLSVSRNILSPFPADSFRVFQTNGEAPSLLRRSLRRVSARGLRRSANSVSRYRSG